MQETKYVTITSKRKKILLAISTIIYVQTVGKKTRIHVSGGTVYETRMTIGEIAKSLGDYFIKVHRGCRVSAMAVHNITDKINLSNGECLE